MYKIDQLHLYKINNVVPYIAKCIILCYFGQSHFLECDCYDLTFITSRYKYQNY